jgi:LuxR family maltose regulon positive regulatory protein
MLATLLRAKLHRPAPARTTIARPRLLARLAGGLASKVTLVSAPAGFGKSTLISAWIDHLSASPPACSASWLNLDEADNQLPRFLRYLAAAIDENFPQSCTAVVALSEEKPPPTVEALADVLVDSLTRLPGPLVLVLDDLHLIDEVVIYTFLARLIQHAPPQFHLVLITRVDPPLPLNRWRGQGHLQELRLHDLCFNLAETSAFLRMNLERPPTEEMAATLHERTEGWVVGLRLVALALRGESDYSAVVAGFEANSTRYIIDYLMDDVLDHQPPGVQQFLICTSTLTRFCPALCAAVVEIDEAAAQQHIHHVARANLFLIELSSPVPNNQHAMLDINDRHVMVDIRWYRYHHQFQSMLLSKLHERYDAQAIAMLHRQAAAWLAAHDQVDEALRHLTAIPDYDAAAELIESQRLAALNELRFGDLEAWLAILPPPFLQQRLVLALSLAWVQFDQMDHRQSLATLQRAAALMHEQAAGEPSGPAAVTQQLLEAELAALRVAVDSSLDPVAALALIRQTWTRLRPYVTLTHCHVVLWLAYTCQRLGDLELALAMVLTTLEETTAWPPMGRCRLLHTAGFFYWCDGNIAQAERTFLQNLRLARQYQLLLIATISQHGLGAIAEARNQQELAEDYHLEVVKNPHVTNGRDAVMDLYYLIGIYARRGQPEAGRSLVEQLKAFALMIGLPFLLNQVAALEAYVDLRCGNVAAAMRWALAGALGAPRGEMYNGADRVPLIRAQVLMAEGSPASLLEASQLLEELSRRHESEHAWHRAVEVYILQALTWAKLKQREPALGALGRAVQKAVPNGLVGPFIGQGEAMERLLHELGKRADYALPVQLLLAAFPVEPMAPDQDRFASAHEVLPGQAGGASAAPLATSSPRGVLSTSLPEPLTEREIDILQLLAERLSNKEIAHRLIISTHTVRNHTANIFGKLQVENRMEAVKRAHALGLLTTKP